MAEALALYRQIGNAWSMSDTLSALGWFFLGRGKLPEARRNLEEGLEIARRIGHKRGVGLLLLGLGRLAYVEGDRRQARELLTESVGLLRDLGTPGILGALEYLGHTAIERGRYAPGVRLLAVVVDGYPIYGELWMLTPSARQAELDARLAAARAAVGEEAFAAAWAEGQAMTPEQALEDALAEKAD
jgi:hypothetical protein